MDKSEGRKIRADLTEAEKENLKKYGVINFKSARAKRER
jgi:hypothetical protein